MKKQIAPSAMGHLIRGAFYLLLLLGICLIPLAFPQRVIIQRAAPHLAPSQTHTFPTGGCGRAWRVVPSSNGSANTNILFGIFDRWAVGTYYDQNFVAQTLIEYWDGTSWTILFSPNPGSSGNQFNGVAPTYDSGVWAVGFFTDDNFIAHTLIEHCDSFSCSVVPSPDNGINGSYLQSVTATSYNDVWAVGYYVDENQVNQTLVEHWDGKSWAIVTSPNRGTGGSQLNGIAALSPTDIWAVGYSGQGNGVVTLIEHWNGSAWNIVDSPNPGTSGNYLQGASTVYDNSTVWVVGYYYESGHPRTLIERWDGSSWTLVPSPNVGTIGNSLFGVSGYFNDVWAVGAYSLDNQTGTLQTLIEHWDGSIWNVVPSPNQGTADNILYGITYYFNFGWSVGTFSDGINGRTLTVRYNDPCPTPTATPTETCRVISADCRDFFTPPTDFNVSVSCPVDFCGAGGFTVNNVPADSCTVSDLITITFHFNTSPAVPGLNTMHLDFGAFTCCLRQVDEFTCTFHYVAPTPTPSPTATATATPSLTPRPTPTPRPRPTPRVRP